MLTFFKTIIDLVLDKKNLKYVVTILLSGFIWIPMTWLVMDKVTYAPRIDGLNQDKIDLKQEIDKKETRIEKLEKDTTEFSSQKSYGVVQDGKIEQSQITIFELNKNINQCLEEKSLLDSKIKDLNNTIDQKDKVIENFNVNEPILAQIKVLQKERHDLLHPWMITSKKNDEEVDRNAKDLNEQIIALQKSITCKS